MHGNPGSAADWKDLAGRTGAFARAVAFDMPGFGHADKPRDFEYTVPGEARFLDAALSDLGIERVHFVLHDLGGPWGMEWAASHPDRVASVVLFNTGAFVDYHWHILARIWQTPVLGELLMATSQPVGVPHADEPRPEAQAVRASSSTRCTTTSTATPATRC